MSEIIKCPYCGHEFDVDLEGYDGDDSECEEECPECGKYFIGTLSIDYNLSSEKADCLNGGPHKWRLQVGVPKCLMKMECIQCHETRELTEDERKKYRVGTVKDYFDNLHKQCAKINK